MFRAELPQQFGHLRDQTQTSMSDLRVTRKK